MAAYITKTIKTVLQDVSYITDDFSQGIQNDTIEIPCGEDTADDASILAYCRIVTGATLINAIGFPRAGESQRYRVSVDDFYRYATCGDRVLGEINRTSKEIVSFNFYRIDALGGGYVYDDIAKSEDSATFEMLCNYFVGNNINPSNVSFEKPIYFFDASSNEYFIVRDVEIETKNYHMTYETFRSIGEVM